MRPPAGRRAAARSPCPRDAYDSDSYYDSSWPEDGDDAWHFVDPSYSSDDASDAAAGAADQPTEAHEDDWGKGTGKGNGGSSGGDWSNHSAKQDYWGKSFGNCHHAERQFEGSRM